MNSCFHHSPFCYSHSRTSTHWSSPSPFLFRNARTRRNYRSTMAYARQENLTHKQLCSRRVVFFMSFAVIPILKRRADAIEALNADHTELKAQEQTEEEKVLVRESSSRNLFFSILTAIGFLGPLVLVALYASAKQEKEAANATTESMKVKSNKKEAPEKAKEDQSKLAIDTIEANGIELREHKRLVDKLTHQRGELEPGPFGAHNKDREIPEQLNVKLNSLSNLQENAESLPLEMNEEDEDLCILRSKLDEKELELNPPSSVYKQSVDWVTNSEIENSKSLLSENEEVETELSSSIDERNESSRRLHAVVDEYNHFQLSAEKKSASEAKILGMKEEKLRLLEDQVKFSLDKTCLLEDQVKISADKLLDDQEEKIGLLEGQEQKIRLLEDQGKFLSDKTCLLEDQVELSSNKICLLEDQEEKLRLLEDQEEKLRLLEDQEEKIRLLEDQVKFSSDKICLLEGQEGKIHLLEGEVKFSSENICLLEDQVKSSSETIRLLEDQIKFSSHEIEQRDTLISHLSNEKDRQQVTLEMQRKNAKNTTSELEITRTALEKSITEASNLFDELNRSRHFCSELETELSKARNKTNRESEILSRQVKSAKELLDKSNDEIRNTSQELLEAVRNCEILEKELVEARMTAESSILALDQEKNATAALNNELKLLEARVYELGESRKRLELDLDEARRALVEMNRHSSFLSSELGMAESRISNLEEEKEAVFNELEKGKRASQEAREARESLEEAHDLVMRLAKEREGFEKRARKLEEEMASAKGEILRLRGEINSSKMRDSIPSGEKNNSDSGDGVWKKKVRGRRRVKPTREGDS